MDVYEAIRTRRSIRVYEDKPVKEEKIQKVLNAARLAPSAGNRQPWRFIVVKDPKVREEVRLAKERGMQRPSRGPMRGPLYTAPILIVGCALPSESFPGTDFWKIDVSIALQNLVLAAWEQGLGTCWVGVFHDKDEIKKVLGVPQEVRIVTIIALGYPAEKKEPVKDRRSLEEIVRYDRW